MISIISIIILGHVRCFLKLQAMVIAKMSSQKSLENIRSLGYIYLNIAKI